MKINLSLKKKPSITGFDNESPNSVYKEFHEHSWGSSDNEFPLPKHLKILYADYTYEDYSGDAYVLGYNFDKQQWFEVHGSHCSCYGLEDQWDEEYYDSKEQLIAVMKKRFSRESRWGRCAESSEELKKWLEG